MIRMPKCGSSSGTATMPRPRSCDLDAERVGIDRQCNVRIGSSRVLGGVGERLADDRVGGLHRGVVERLDVSLHRDGRRQPPASREVADECGERGLRGRDVFRRHLEEQLADVAQVLADLVFDLVQDGDRALRVGLDPVPQGLQLQDRPRSPTASGRRGSASPSGCAPRAGSTPRHDAPWGDRPRSGCPAGACSAPTRTLRSLPARSFGTSAFSDEGPGGLNLPALFLSAIGRRPGKLAVHGDGVRRSRQDAARSTRRIAALEHVSRYWQKSCQ